MRRCLAILCVFILGLVVGWFARSPSRPNASPGPLQTHDVLVVTGPTGQTVSDESGLAPAPQLRTHRLTVARVEGEPFSPLGPGVWRIMLGEGERARTYWLVEE